ncbi:hypothetical protein ASG88_20745 [Nocardioides sp. Soil777]|uniref:hypothetical protein n=1 Tax=Nocardioides sp. Soil777 TaxID=1736409 RepID=UPI00070316F2|nr:hypothetical protein [Nocardioides sp. Soil777]KRF05920.1 hypothetical protein ASG88_20745 [Nocardioides sp. Soil777]
MTTQQIIWIVVIAVAALAIIGFIVSSMRKRSQQDNRARAAEIREQAEAKAAVIPEAQARAEAEEARAEQVRLEAERAEERAREARGAVAQEEALHEDRIRAADRLDPDVDHKAKDYTPGSHAAERTEPEAADPHPSGASMGTHAADSSTHTDAHVDRTSAPSGAVDEHPTEQHPTEQHVAGEPAHDEHPTMTDATEERARDEHATTSDPETIFDSRDSETSSTDSSTSETPTTPGRRIDPDAAPEPDWTDPDQRDGTAGGTTGGSHRA